MAAAVAGMKSDESITPRDRVTIQYSHGYLGRVFFWLRKLYPTQVALVWVLFLMYLAWTNHVPGRFINVLAMTALALLLLPIYIAIIAPLLSPARAYDRLVEHACWGRWEEVLRLLPSLPEGVPAHERALREAQALAGLGRLGEALAVFEPFAHNGEIPDWLYWSQVSRIYAADRNWDRAVAVQERAVELAPDQPALLIDLAIALLRHKHDPRRAKELLDQAGTHAIVPIAFPFLCTAKGLLALERGDAREAVDQFLEALKKAHACLQDNAMTRFFIDQTHANLAVAYSRLLNSKLALRHFHLAGARLRERGWDLLPIDVGG
jgi:tetratricopeptide (TPR) repeat protein